MNVRAVTNVTRLVSLAAAIVIAATEWQAFSSPRLPIQPVPAVAASVADDASESAMPVIVVTADRNS